MPSPYCHLGRHTSILLLVGFLVFSQSGCLSPWISSSDDETEVDRIDELFAGPERPELVRDATIAMGMKPLKLEAIGIVNGLHRTGGIPEPSPQRDTIIGELQTRNIEDPNRFIDADETAMVSVQGIVAPGALKGDPVDLFVRISSRCTSNSLRGGWLMPARMREVRLLHNQVRSSDVLATARGNILLRTAYEEGDQDTYVREGVIPSGAVCTQSRSVGLIIRPTFTHAIISAQIANDINRRFFFFDGTKRRGIANAKEDDFIEISVHPTYRRNIHRLMAVVKAISVKESIEERHARIEDLKKRLTEPTTASDAALQLEAIGEEGIDALRVAATVANPEIRFYAAEALAYQDHVDAIDPLVEIAETQPAFRYRSLLALSILEHRLAAEGLRKLLDSSSAETRYGAFRAMRERADNELLIPGASIGEDFRLFQIPSTGPPLVVASTSKFAEVVVFGGPIAINPPKYLIAGSGIMIRGDRGQLKISRFQASKSDQRSTVAPTITGLLKGITDVGGNYSDVVEILRLCSLQGDLQAKYAIDPLPKTQRTYHRDQADFVEGDEVGPEKINQAEEPEEARWWDLGNWAKNDSDSEK